MIYALAYLCQYTLGRKYRFYPLQRISSAFTLERMPPDPRTAARRLMVFDGQIVLRAVFDRKPRISTPVR